MATTLFLPFVSPRDHNAPSGRQCLPAFVVEASPAALPWGANSIMFRSGSVSARAIWEPHGVEWIRRETAAFPVDFNDFTRDHRRRADASRQALAEVTGRTPADLEGLHPLVAVMADRNTSRVYHFADQGQWGSIFVRYHQEPVPVRSAGDVVRCMLDGYDALQTARRSVNDACNYGRWRQDLEFERKFTFDRIPDTWAMINDLYRRVIEGDIEGFIPEVNLEFQAFDYEVTVFEILDPPTEAGYVAFIPQVDGRVCVKQKWFRENAEIRKETLSHNVKLDPTEYEQHAREKCAGRVRRLPVYRRKRFDVNFESLETGNVYGIFFDICRTSGGVPAHAFSQCEVEYCRSRTWGPFTQIFEQFEVACAYAERFLTEHGVGYVADLYSKLDFLREAADASGRRELAHA